jgi:hypothetical protein
MLAFGRRLLAICAVATVAGCGGAQATAPEPAAPTALISTPTAQLTSPPSPTGSQAGSQTFTSEFYGYRIDLPSDWLVRAASTPWVSGELEDRCPSDWDCFSTAAYDRTLAVAAFDVAKKKTSLSDWHAAMNRGTPSFCTDSSPNETTLDGEPALIWTAACASEGVNVIKLAALRGTSAYMFLFVSQADQSAEANQATFDSLLSTFRFGDRPTPT